MLSTGSILLYGPSGNGKSTIAAHLRAMLPGYAAVPHALEVGGQIVKVGEKFKNGLRYPHEFGAPPAEVCNCRCDAVAVE